MYFLLALRYPLVYARTAESREVIEPAGHVWSTGDIRATAALVALFTMMSLWPARFAMDLVPKNYCTLLSIRKGQIGATIVPMLRF
jgi:hypothetical protein